MVDTCRHSDERVVVPEFLPEVEVLAGVFPAV